MTKTLLLVLCIGAAFASLAIGATPTEQCFDFRKAQDFTRAIAAGRSAVKQSPKDAEALFCLGSTYRSIGSFDLARSYLLQAEALYTKKVDLASVYLQLGGVASAKGELEQALNYYSRALALARELADHHGESVALGDVALVFQDRGELDKALEYYQKSIAIEPDDSRNGATYNNIALIYSERGDYDSAISTFDKAIAIHRRIGDYQGAAQVILNKGAVLTDAKKFPESESNLNEGLDAVKKVGDTYWESVAYLYLGELAEARDQPAAAIANYTTALQLARASGATDEIQGLGRVLARLKKDTSTTTYAVIEIGAKGVKGAAVASFRDDQGRLHYSASFKKAINTNVIQGVAESGEFSQESIDSTAKAVSDLLTEIKANAKNVGDRIYVAGSSSLAQAMNRDDLGAKILALTGITPTFIDSSQELAYAMTGSIPDKLLYKSALLDIGSGNGRIGYLISPRGGNPGGRAVIDIPVGSVSLTDLVNKDRAVGESFVAALNRIVDKDISPRFLTEIKQYPAISHHRYIVAVGGAAWAMATLVHPENQEAYVPLKLQDFIDYYDRISSNPDATLSPSLAGITDPKVRDAAAAEVDSVKKAFTVENLQAGARILKMIAETVPIGSAQIFFARNGNWAFGLAADRAYVDGLK
jgi:tetratricopeptide (TPR) repeat protein